MKEDVIRQVKNAEDQAEEKIRDAQARAENVLHDARHQAVELRMEIVEAARTKSKTLFETGMKDFEPTLTNVRRQFQADIAEDRKKADKEFGHVVEFVLTRFHEKLEGGKSD